MNDKILEIKNLNISFTTYSGTFHVIRKVGFDLFHGETLAIVGESGSGKSVTVKSIMGLLAKNARITSGDIIYQNSPLLPFDEKTMMQIRGSEIAMIFQDPLSSLDPIMKIGNQIIESMCLKESVSRKDAKKKAIELMNAVGIPEPEKRYNQYPFQFSGGMRQRIVIAIALAGNPKILICDEPTTALDVTIQAQILDLIKDIQKKRNLSVIFITHDLGVVAQVADRALVMYAGEIVEGGLIQEIFYEPKNPYTWALLSSIPDLDTTSEDMLYAIPGAPPNMMHLPKGDSFAPRNQYALNIDFNKPPPSFQVSETHWARSWLLDKRAPIISLPQILQKRIDKKDNGGKRHNINNKHYNGGMKHKALREKQSPVSSPEKSAVLEVIKLRQYFSSGFGFGKHTVKAVNDISFCVYKGETFGLVGESGCGKTTTGRSIIGLYTPTGGEILFNGKIISKSLSREAKQEVTSGIQMIFQDPIASLNPRMTVQEIIAEGLTINRLCKSKDEITKRVIDMLITVGLSAEHGTRYPHEFSGGQRQRICIARALITKPKLIIADEPISALDVSIQAQILNLLNSIKKEFGLTILFIAHDLSIVKYFSDRIGVMHQGKLVELASSRELFEHPLHPYTRSLLSAIPVPDPFYKTKEKRIEYNTLHGCYEHANQSMIEVNSDHFVYGNKKDFQLPI